MLKLCDYKFTQKQITAEHGFKSDNNNPEELLQKRWLKKGLTFKGRGNKGRLRLADNLCIGSRWENIVLMYNLITLLQKVVL